MDHICVKICNDIQFQMTESNMTIVYLIKYMDLPWWFCVICYF